jgi:hypothetical protein
MELALDMDRRSMVAAANNNFGYGNLTEEQQMALIRQMVEREANRARLQQHRDPHYNKYLKYKNKYLSLKNNIYLGK